MKKILLIVIISIVSVSLSNIQAVDTSPQFVQSTDTLVVYTDVPGLAPSEFYSIKVRSAATNNEWIECYANITRSLYPTSGSNENYWAELKNWSHTYSNIEMSKGSLVEVQIAAKNGFKIKGSDFTTANAHPVHKASKPTVVNNIVYFTIDNPSLITIDINGQMDETNTANGYAGPAVHTVSLFANPIVKKPALNDPNIVYAEPGVKPSTNLGVNTTLYFKPGVHIIGRDFTIFANKNYYIPGDAVVYGTLVNLNNTVGSGANIRIYGYGTLSGDKIKHPEFDVPKGNDNTYRMVYSEKCTNFVVEGISLMNGPMHTMKVTSTQSNKNETFAKWLKVVTWRVNGDGLGNVNYVSDCFIRTQDDCVYVKGDRKSCVFWTDANGSIFSMAGMDEAKIKPFYIEDIDVIYARNRSTNNNGGRVFAKRSDQKAISTRVNVVFNNIRITDKYETHETFQILSTGPGTSGGGVQTSGGYTGITFKNISSVKPPVAGGNRITGWSGGIWDDITFDNVVLGGKRILSRADFGNMGPEAYVTNVKFIITSINEIKDTNSEFTIYVNSGTNKLNVNAKSKIVDKIQLIDMTGKIVFSGNSKMQYKKNKFELIH